MRSRLAWLTCEPRLRLVRANDSGRVLSFATEAALLEHAAKLGVQVADESSILHDLDRVRDELLNRHRFSSVRLAPEHARSDGACVPDPSFTAARG